MQKNEISAKTLNAGAQGWIEKLRQVMLIQDKAMKNLQEGLSSIYCQSGL